MKHKYESLVGNEINGLKIIRFFRTNNGVRGARKRSYYECICICGKLFTSRSDHIKNGSSKSCGCITYKLAAKGHTLPNNQGAINDMYRGYGSGAKQRGLAFLLLKNEFENLIFKDCFYCGTPPSIRVWKVDKITPYNLCCNGIDRVNSNFGYTSDNCVSCCPQCNYAKSDLSLEDFRKWISQIVAFNTKPEAK